MQMKTYELPVYMPWSKWRRMVRVSVLRCGAQVNRTLEGIWKSDEIINALVRNLQDSDEKVRTAVVQALVELSNDGPSVIQC